MDTALLIVILLLMLLLICFLMFYFFTQQSLRDITARLNVALQQPVPKKNADNIRRERAFSHDQLMLLEADLTNNPRPKLTLEELANVDQISKTIRACIAELKKGDEWIGLPFDFEWIDVLARLPNVNKLYRQAMEAESDLKPTVDEHKKIGSSKESGGQRR